MNSVLEKHRGFVLCAVCAVSSAAAQQLPDAGTLLREAEQRRQQQQQQIPTPKAPGDSPLAPSRPRPAEGPKIVVKRFAFEGNERFTEQQLAPVLAQYLNRSVSLADLETAAADVARYYRAAGWAARVIVPPQEVDQGVIRLKVVEGVLGQTRFSSDTDTATLPVRPKTIVDDVQGRVAPGEKLNIPNVERGLLLADELPGVGVKGSQVSGAGEGQTDILLTAISTGSYFGEASLDNQGSRSTGGTRALFRLGANSPFGIGDRFDATAQLTEYMRYLRLAGSLPLGSDGLRLSANIAALRYRVGTPEFAPAATRGDSRNFGAELLYPLVRATDRNVYLNLAAERKRPYNTVVTGVVSDYEISNVLLRLDANIFDSLAGGGVSSLGLTEVLGRVDLSDSPPSYIANDAATTHVQGHFRALRWRLSHNRHLNADWTVTANFSGQQANRNLDSAEKFYLGGPFGVRAYPSNEAGGSKGQMFNLDLRWKLPISGAFNVELGAFYDWGRITVNADNLSAGGLPIALLNHYSLSGYGFGLVADGPHRTRFSATVARRIGSNPAANLQTGRDQDGSLDLTRIWLTLGINF